MGLFIGSDNRIAEDKAVGFEHFGLRIGQVQRVTKEFAVPEASVRSGKMSSCGESHHIDAVYVNMKLLCVRADVIHG